MSITENIAAIRREIDAAARESGRTGADITLVGASKMNDAAVCQEAIAAGIDVVGKVALIQSVGSMELLREIEKEAAKQGLRQDILLEVNIGGEEAKSGFAPEDVRAAAQSALELAHVRVLGLMAIPPVETVPHGNMRYFAEMRALYVDINEKMYHNEFKYLSMGMSEDFADAIRAGANMVRVGSAIFGARDYTK